MLVRGIRFIYFYLFFHPYFTVYNFDTAVTHPYKKIYNTYTYTLTHTKKRTTFFFLFFNVSMYIRDNIHFIQFLNIKTSGLFKWKLCWTLYIYIRRKRMWMESEKRTQKNILQAISFFNRLIVIT